MIEIPIVILGFMLAMFAALGFLLGRTVELTTREGRRRRALSRVTPIWEVHVGSDGTNYGHGVVGTGTHVVVSARKVRRSGSHFEPLQRIEIARVRGEHDPDEILAAIDRAQRMVATLGVVA